MRRDDTRFRGAIASALSRWVTCYRHAGRDTLVPHAPNAHQAVDFRRGRREALRAGRHGQEIAGRVELLLTAEYTLGLLNS